MGMMSNAGYDIWTEDVTETINYPTSTNGVDECSNSV